MLKMLEILGHQGNTLKLPLGDIVDGIMITSIDGLDPVDASISSSPFAQVPGERFQASRLNKRNIILTLNMEPFYGGLNVATIRKNLYRFFMPGSPVNFKFHMESGLVVDLDNCRVETFDAPMFVQDPKVTISILAFDPDFVDKTIVTKMVGSQTNPRWVDMIYDGTAPTGVTMSFQVYESSPNGFVIQNVLPHGDMQKMTVDTPMYVGDRVYINTKVREKEILITRNSAARSYMYALTPNSKWISLTEGKNRFTFTIGSILQHQVSVSYQNRYGGL